MSSQTYRGRHRVRSTRSRKPRLLGTGLLLPTSAAATLVITASGAHLGQGLSPSASAAGTAALTRTGNQTASPALEQPGASSRARLAQDRVARDSSRQPVDAALGENTRRQADEAARMAAEQAQQAAQQVSTTGDPQPGAAPPADGSGAAAGQNWVKPVAEGYTLTSPFGMRWGSMHPAQDVAIPMGTPIRAMTAGKVLFAGWEGSYGYKVDVEYWDGTVVWYGHNSSVKVRAGQTVTAGQVVALSGNSGRSTGPHVHIEIRPKNGAPVNPLPWLRARGIPL